MRKRKANAPILGVSQRPAHVKKCSARISQSGRNTTHDRCNSLSVLYADISNDLTLRHCQREWRYVAQPQGLTMVHQGPAPGNPEESMLFRHSPELRDLRQRHGVFNSDVAPFAPELCSVRTSLSNSAMQSAQHCMGPRDLHNATLARTIPAVP